VKPFAVVVPIGPGAMELRRLRDLLDSLWHYEPGARLCVAIDSSPYPRSLKFPRRRSCRLITLRSPFHGRGEPLMGRLSASLLLAYELIRRSGPFDFVLRADTDALITGRFRQRVSRFLQAHPQTGMLGTLGFTCRRDSPHYGCEKTSVSDVVAELAKVPADEPLVHRVASHLRAAQAYGYVGKEYCQGGVYVLPFRTLEQMSVRGCLDYPEDWLPLAVPEDVMIGMLTRAAGLESTDLSRRGQPFGSNYRGLAYPPREMLSRKHALIHSVKTDPVYTELALRRFFKSTRFSK
jgi:hypothetical protein